MGQYANFSDIELHELVKQGSEPAFTVIYQRYWALLYRHALRMLQDEDEAEDAVQETFVLFFNKAKQIELKGSLAAYLYTAVRNRVINHFEHGKVKRRYIAELERFMEEGNVQADYLLREKQLTRLIEQEVAALPKAQREAFELSRSYHLSYKEIAQQLSVSENTVRNNISRAMKILRKKMEGFRLFSFLII